MCHPLVESVQQGPNEGFGTEFAVDLRFNVVAEQVWSGRSFDVRNAVRPPRQQNPQKVGAP